MPRRVYPRRVNDHAAMAQRVIDRHARRTGQPAALPIPIELIIEQTYELSIDWEEFPERDGELILGALSPQGRVIVLNSRHQAMFDNWIGPERFTLAHELAHWLYDADDPAQASFDFGCEVSHFCYHRETPGLSEVNRIREVNANKLAANLLMPEGLVRAANLSEVLSDLPGTAERWQVSRTALRIRLEELGLLVNRDTRMGRLQLA